jgi:transcriptional regulator with XRE-family HTH domain
MSFGSFLKEWRIARELTIRQCCADLGTDPVYWSKLERGVVSPPPAEELTKWADYLRVGRAELLALAASCVPKPDTDERDVAASFTGSISHRGSSFDELMRQYPRIRMFRTPEAFLGVAKTQTSAAMAAALEISVRELGRAIRKARSLVSAEFLRELDGPQPEFVTGACVNDSHREHRQRLREHLAKLPKATLREAIRHYERIKRQSNRHRK